MNNCEEGCKIVSRLESELIKAKRKARYWQEKYNAALDKQIELENAVEKITGESVALKRQLDEELHLNKLPYGFIEQSAHDIALAYLQRAWKRQTVLHENSRATMDAYLAAYNYAIERLQKGASK